MNIGEAIKKLRTKRAVTQQTLAKKVGISQGLLSLIEKGKREPGFDLIDEIAGSLKVPQQLILLMSCDNKGKAKEFSKPLRSIMSALDEIFAKI